MFCVTLLVDALQSYRFMFHSEEAARKAVEVIDNYGPVLGGSPPIIDRIFIADEFGQEFHGQRSAVRGYIIEDAEKSKLATVEMILHQERLKILAQKMAQADPSLRTMSGRNGPGVLTPFPRGN